MCGIAGILHFNKTQKVSEELLLNMREAIKHRGPDGAGSFIDQEIGLAHRRLSILDLSEHAAQPFFSEDKRFVIVFNGEIFNFKELRSALETQGEVFRTNSDTEVLLRLYMKEGKACLEKLNGMFAFAIWDCIERNLFISRDRIGIKPFYYALYDNTFYFASEPKALFKAGVPKEFNHECLQELLLFKYIAGENTSFKHVKRLLPGHTITIKHDALQINCWWNLAEKILANRTRIPKNPFDWFEETFYSSVAYRTISDVPVGVMLSGGLDSGSIAVALHHNQEKNIAAFTVGFHEEQYNEAHLAKQVCDQFGLDFHSIKIEGQELFDAMIEATILHDEPLIHQNDAQMLALAKFAKNYVTVLLSGEGGDEFMGGYVRYKPLNYHRVLKLAGLITGQLKSFQKGGIVNRFDKLSRYVQGNTLNELVLLNASNIYPNDFKQLGLQVDVSKMSYRHKVLYEAQLVYPNEPARQAMYCDLFIHMASVLDRNDRMTMGAGIECRVPFMDYRLMEMIPALPSNYLLKGKKGKYLLYNSVAQKLPNEVLHFKKLGFSVPWERYLKEDERFKMQIENIQHGSLNEFIPEINLKELFKSSVHGNTSNILFIRQLLALEIWNNEYLKN